MKMFLRRVRNRLADLRNKRVLYTIWFNFRNFPFDKARHLPVLFYDGAYATILQGGRLELTEQFWANNGRVLVGYPSLDFEYQCEKTHLNIVGGVLRLNGSLDVRRGCIVEIKGVCTFGEDVVFGPRCRVRVHNELLIGSTVRVAHETQIFDSNFHYVENVNEPGFNPISKPIRIGSYVWICNRSTVQAGSVLPSRTILASNSLLNRDFADLEPGSLIGGTPARFIKRGVSRVWDRKREFEYHKREFEWYRRMYE